MPSRQATILTETHGKQTNGHMLPSTPVLTPCLVYFRFGSSVNFPSVFLVEFRGECICLVVGHILNARSPVFLDADRDHLSCWGALHVLFLFGLARSSFRSLGTGTGTLR